MQLSSFGAQDAYLTSNPSVTFFQSIYRRYSAFAAEWIEQVINGSVGNGGRISCTIARNGDLVGAMMVELKTKVGLATSSANDATSMEWVAERAIADIEFSLGGQRIDRHTQRWWRLYSELMLDTAKKQTYGKMTSSSVGGSHVYLPLLFFFNRHVGLSLPLLSLQFHECRVDVTLASNFDTYFDSSVFRIWAQYYFLETAERKVLATKSSEMLVETLQFTGTETLASAGNNTNRGVFRLSLNHPVKELIFAISKADTSANHHLWDFCDVIGTTAESAKNTPVMSTKMSLGTVCDPNGAGAGVPSLLALSNAGCMWVEGAAGTVDTDTECGIVAGALDTMGLKLNGQDRSRPQTGKWHNTVVPSQHHSGSPYPGIYCYSFALTPETVQPSGSLNFSRVDSAQIEVSTVGPNSKYLSLFAVSLNILRVASGMGGLGFAS
jgi:hypothetical protein